MYSVQDTQQAEWVSPFGNPRVKGCLSPHRGLSQTTTSFIASYCLGIHHVRLVAWPYNPKLSRLSFLRLALLVAHSVGHVSIPTLPALVREPPRQSQKILYETLPINMIEKANIHSTASFCAAASFTFLFGREPNRANTTCANATLDWINDLETRH